MINIVLLAISLRLACYAVLPALTSNIWAVLPVELLHGITFACGFGAAAVHAKRIAPVGMEATMQVSIGCGITVRVGWK
jgi:Na+/glutamate symporter